MKLYYIKISLSLALLVFGMASCLKDKAFEDQKIQSTNPEQTFKIIEMKIAANNAKNFVSLAYDNSNNDTTVELVPIHLSTPGGAPEDINVTLVLKPELVQQYNTDNDASFAVPTAVTIVNPNNIVTIPKGSNTGYLKVKFKPVDLIGSDWAFGFAISSVDKQGYTISGNLGSGVVAMLIKNKWDGTYSVTGNLVDVVNPGLSSVPGDPYPFTVELQTTGANSVVMYANDAHAFGHLIATGSYYGVFEPVFTFDPAANKVVSVVNKQGQPASNGRSAQIDATTDNKINADKSIYVKFFMNQSGSRRTTFTDTLTYVGPR